MNTALDETRILIIDDEEEICRFLVRLVSKMGYGASYHLTLQQGINEIFSDNSGDIAVVFLDVYLPDGDGLGAIAQIKQHPSAPEVIIITGNEDADGAELAIRSHAWDYIAKKESPEKFIFALNRAVEYWKQKRRHIRNQNIQRERIVGESPLLLECLDRVFNASKGDLPVLITGETGTGKELFARAIHDNSRFARADFVVVDCTALPEPLAESVLFGHVKGAFTGAGADKSGLVEMAHKGTLFLDEVGDLPLSIQKKFLRVLQEKTFRPVGSRQLRKSDFRLISATHRDLEKMVTGNTFRQDLYFRMVSLQIPLPSLRYRGNDMVVIAHHCLAQKNRSCPEKKFTMSEEFVYDIQTYEWPGNVRELINTMDLACNEAGTDAVLYPQHLPEQIRMFNIRKKISRLSRGNDPILSGTLGYYLNKPEDFLPFQTHVEQQKQNYIKDLLSATNHNIKRFCAISGLSKGHLYRLLKKYKIPLP
jgi:two-component system, NtrC family, response regulator